MVAEAVPQAELTAPRLSGRGLRWSVERYLKAIEAGVFIPEDRVEMLDGEVVIKMPQDFPHIDGIRLLVAALRAVLGSEFDINAQLPVRTPDSVPEPDVMILRGSARDFIGRYPSSDEVVLVAEVANTTLRDDRRRKAGIYARAGFAEYWILNVADRRLETYRGPLPGGMYAEVRILSVGATAEIEGRSILVADLLP